MISKTTPTIAFSTINIRETADDGTHLPIRVCAIGYVSCDLESEAIAIDAFAVDPATPARETAEQLAAWLLERPGAPAYLVGWALENTVIAGLLDIADKLDLEPARDLLEKAEQWASLGIAELSAANGDVLDVATAAAALAIKYGAIDPEILGEGRGEHVRAHLRDAVAAQAVVTWAQWATGPGACAHLSEKAAATLADWRSAQAAA